MIIVERFLTASGQPLIGHGSDGISYQFRQLAILISQVLHRILEPIAKGAILLAGFLLLEYVINGFVEHRAELTH